MTDEQQQISDAVRAVLGRNGVFMTRSGPVGPGDVEKRVMAGASREEAIREIATRVAQGESA